MPKPFDELRDRLLRAAVAPRPVRRYLGELANHLADLRAEDCAPAAAQSMPNRPRLRGSARRMSWPRR